MHDEVRVDSEKRRLSKRTRVIIAVVVATTIIGFCAIPWVIFGGMASVEEFFRPADTAVEARP